METFEVIQIITAIFGITGVVLIPLNTYISRELWLWGNYSNQVKIASVLLIWLAPFVGAFIFKNKLNIKLLGAKSGSPQPDGISEGGSGEC